MKSEEQKFKDRLEREATRSAVHFFAVALQEGNSKGRLNRLISITNRANKRASRRLKAAMN